MKNLQLFETDREFTNSFQDLPEVYVCFIKDSNTVKYSNENLVSLFI